MIAAVHTSYANGMIRNAAGKLVAYWDESLQELVLDGYVRTFQAPDIETAMALVSRNEIRKEFISTQEA